MVTDPYQVLGVPKSASPDEIKKAYRKLAKQYHPDLHPDDPVAAKKMNEINEAYDMLQHPEKYKNRQNQSGQQARSGGYSYGGGGAYGGYGSSGSGGSYGGYGSSGSGSSGNGSGGYGGQGNGRYQGEGGWYTDFGGFTFEDLFNYAFGGARYDTTPHPQSGDPDDLVRAINAINGRRYQEAIQILSAMTSNYRNARWYYVNSVAHYGAGDTVRAQDLLLKAIQMEPNNRMYVQLYQQYSNSERMQTQTQTTRGGMGPIGRIIMAIIFFQLLMLLFRACTFGFFMW